MIQLIKKYSFFFKMLVVIWLLSQIDASFAAINFQSPDSAVSSDIKWSDKTIAALIQDVIAWIMGFLYVLAVLFGIYGWILILTAAWDEEKVKKWKTVIINVIIWLIVIFLVSSIITWILELFTKTQ